MSGRHILTAAEMRAAEERAIAAGTPVETLMERAGAGAADAIRLYAGHMPALILCGPGNNGGDGYVIARLLRERGIAVRVAGLGEPRSAAAAAARAAWKGPIEELADAAPAPLLVDALFGTGLLRPLERDVAQPLMRLAAAAKVRVAVDLPSGVATDDGSVLSPVPDYDLTITFATLKPSHLLQPAARHMGRIVTADIGIEAKSLLQTIARPKLPAPGPDDHKYTRGYVAVVAGEMPGAAALAAAAALRAGAGYVRLLGDEPVQGVAQAVVQTRGDPLRHLSDERIDALAIGPGLGKSEASIASFLAAINHGVPLVLDGDALGLWGSQGPFSLPGAILTPHAGEFRGLFGTGPGGRAEQARRAAKQNVIVLKGSDTVVAAPDGRAAIATPPPSLATAGTGDVLTGVIAAMRATGLDPFEAACAGVWLHARAAQLAGPGLIADDLIPHLAAARSECR